MPVGEKLSLQQTLEEKEVSKGLMVIVVNRLKFHLQPVNCYITHETPAEFEEQARKAEPVPGSLVPPTEHSSEGGKCLFVVQEACLTHGACEECSR